MVTALGGRSDVGLRRFDYQNVNVDELAFVIAESGNGRSTYTLAATMEDTTPTTTDTTKTTG